MAMIYRFEKRGRRRAAVLTIVGVWAAVVAVWWSLNISPWIALLILACTLPAVWDVIRDTRSVVEVWPNRIVWASAFGAGDRSDVDHVRLNRRFDGGMRVTLVFIGGATMRLPPDIGSPVADLETALQQAGIPTQRHPFLPF